MNKMLTLIFCLLLGWDLSAQVIELRMDSMLVGPQDTIAYQVYADTSFHQISGAQFSLQWDAAMLNFLSVTALGSNLQTKENLVSIGKLGLVWNAGTDTLFFSENTPFLTLHFLVTGQRDDQSTIRIVDQPTPILFVGCCSDDQQNPIYPLQVFDFEANTGWVKIDAPLHISAAEVSAPRCYGEASGKISTNFGGGSPPYQFKWQSADGFRAETQNVENLIAGTYYLTVTDRLGQEVSDSFRLDGPPPVVVGLQKEFQLCGDQMITIGIEPVNLVSFAWSTGDTTATIEVKEPGTYSLLASDRNGCFGMDTTLVRQMSAPVAFLDSEKDLLCEGESTIIQAFSSDSLSWIDTAGVLQFWGEDRKNVVAKPLYTTEFGLIAQNECASDTVFLTISVVASEASAGSDTCIGIGSTAMLQASGGQEYRWFEALFPVSNPSIPNPTVKPNKNTTFVVEILDLNGCSIIDSVSVAVADDPLQFIKSVNVITPNGDGVNDYLEFDNLTKYGANTLQVFNRWGNIVYSSIGYQTTGERWDGTFRGKPLPSGAYFYLLRINDFQIKQTITLIRD